MLWDPKWEVKPKTKADPLDLSNLIAWLEKRPSQATYCYTSNGQCLLAQYFTACGFKGVVVEGWAKWWHQPEPGCEPIKGPRSPTFHLIARGEPRTFGAALERARQFADAH